MIGSWRRGRTEGSILRGGILAPICGIDRRHLPGFLLNDYGTTASWRLHPRASVGECRRSQERRLSSLKAEAIPVLRPLRNEARPGYQEDQRRKEDFAGALPYWKNYFDEWIFTHNDVKGLAPDVLKLLLDLSEKH